MNKRTQLIFWIVLLGILIFWVTTLFQPVQERGGSNAKLKAQVANLRPHIDMLYQEKDPHSYVDICKEAFTTDEGKRMELESFKEAGEDPKCFSDADSYVFVAKLYSPEEEITHYCVDSQGKFKGITDQQYNTIINPNTLCAQE